MLLLVGLGNPTPNSQNNRHNVGFKIVDAINQKFGLSKQKPKFKGLLTTGNIGEKKIYAIKPLTFMNNSGICIRELLEYFKIDAGNVVVFHDDLDVEFGKIKAKLSDRFVMPYSNVQEAIVANGGAYPPDMSVLVKARKGGADYIYSVLMGYEDPPAGMELDDGVYYNKYMYGNKIKMASPLSDDIIEYTDGTKATMDQMARDVTTFLQWTAEPHLETRHKTGFRVIIYLLILTVLVYFSMKRIWSRIESKV